MRVANIRHPETQKSVLRAFTRVVAIGERERERERQRKESERWKR